MAYQKSSKSSDFEDFCFSQVPLLGSCFFLTQTLTPTGAGSGKHQTARDRILPIVCAALSWASVVTWAMGIPIRCCPFFFFVASERLSHPPTAAVCGRHFLFSAGLPLPCRSAGKWPVGFLVCHGQGPHPSTSIPAVPHGVVLWRGRGSRARTRRCKSREVSSASGMLPICGLMWFFRKPCEVLNVDGLSFTFA